MTVLGCGFEALNLGIEVPSQVFELVLIGPNLKSYPYHRGYSLGSLVMFFDLGLPVSWYFAVKQMLHMPNCLLLIGWSHAIWMSLYRLLLRPACYDQASERGLVLLGYRWV